MIHPNMATMLSIVLTDATASPGDAPRASCAARPRATWTSSRVDGDTSTNDTVFLLASGRAGAASADDDPAPRAALAAGARGRRPRPRAPAGRATARARRRSSPARSPAPRTTRTRGPSPGPSIASSLVKAAVHGRDPNWGRIAGAAGNAPLAEAAVLEAAGLDAAERPSRAGAAGRRRPGPLRIAIAGHLAYDGPRGGPVAVDKGAARAAMAGDEVLIRLDLGLGDGTGEAFGCDLTEAYVRENSEYTT